MSPQLEAQLHAHPSEFYADLVYFECGDGWASLLGGLADKISALKKSGRLKRRIRATQAKEKYGALSVYFYPSSAQIDKLVEQTRTAALSVCEHCGKEGKQRSIGGWLSTLCDSDYDAWLKKVQRT
jgi:hypothetical protein